MPGEVQVNSLSSAEINSWLQNNATESYRLYINNIACTMDRSSATYRFCLHDTVVTQSGLLGQLTVRSGEDYQAADRVLGKEDFRERFVFDASFFTPSRTESSASVIGISSIIRHTLHSSTEKASLFNLF